MNRGYPLLPRLTLEILDPVHGQRTLSFPSTEGFSKNPENVVVFVFSQLRPRHMTRDVV